MSELIIENWIVPAYCKDALKTYLKKIALFQQFEFPALATAIYSERILRCIRYFENGNIQ